MPFHADACSSGDAAARPRRADRGEMPMDSTEVFREEERNLAATLAKVHEALARATRVSESTNDARRETKFYLSANRGEIDPQEMQQHERLLCEADLQAEQAHLARERLEKLADSPYFARVSFVPDGEGSMPQVAGTHADGDTTAEGDAAARGHAATDGKAPTLDAYIGRFSFGDADGTVVSDWRSPVASLFYDFEPGPASYDAPAGTRTGTLAGKRHLSIEGGNLRSAFEDGSAIRDEVLGYELGKTADNAMRTIVASIQRERRHTGRNHAHARHPGRGRVGQDLHRPAPRGLPALPPQGIAQCAVGRRPVAEQGVRRLHCRRVARTGGRAHSGDRPARRRDGGAERRGFRRSAALPHRRRRRRLAKARPLQGNRAIRRRRGRLRRPGGSRGIRRRRPGLRHVRRGKGAAAGAVPTLRKPAHRRAHRGRGRRRDGGTARASGAASPCPRRRK